MTIRAALLLAAVLAFAACPLLVPPFSGYDLAAFPQPLDRPPLQPAGYAFAIWGVIYLWLVAMAAFGFSKRRDDWLWDDTRVPLIASVAVGAAWLPIALVAPVVATGLLWVMLAAALMALERTPRVDRWWLRAPVGLYAGWLTAAGAVSLATVAAGHGVFGLAPETWGMAALTLAFAVASGVVVTRPSAAYVAALVWALVGVVVADVSQLVRIYAVIGGVMVVGLLATQWRRVVAKDELRLAD